MHVRRAIPGGWVVFLLLPLAGLTGCERPQAAQQQSPPQMPPSEVLVSLPVRQEVRDYEDFPGRTEAVNSIEVRARVTGYLDKVHFREGADVKKGDVLLEIDPRPYQAEYNRSDANLNLAQAHLKRLETDYQRAMSLRPRGISQEEFDKIAGDRAEALATVGVAKAGRDLAELNLNYTKVLAPISGRISRRYLDPGNLVKADDTILTVIVSLDPIYAYFDVDERTALRLQRLIREGKIKWSEDGNVPVLLGLADEAGYPKQGTINFADNRVDPDTGTWRLRALVANPDRLLSPGLFIRIRLPIGDPYQAMLVAEQALGTDQGQKYLYVVDDAGQVSYRRVQVGRQHQGLRVITDGLAPGEKVVVSGLQRVRPGTPVSPKVVDMPVGSGPSAVASGQKSEGKGQKSEAKGGK
jgi:RND family efflux transporter MFP subunit